MKNIEIDDKLFYVHEIALRKSTESNCKGWIEMHNIYSPELLHEKYKEAMFDIAQLNLTRIQQLESELSASKDKIEALERVCLSNKQATKDHLLYIEQLELCISEKQEELKKRDQEIERLRGKVKEDSKPCDHNYKIEKGWNAHQPDYCSNCGEDL